MQMSTDIAMLHETTEQRPRSRMEVGIWTETPAASAWGNDGMSRLIGFLIEGAAVSRRIRLHVAVPQGFGAPVRRDLQTLQASEGLDWTILEPPKDFALRLGAAQWRLAGRLGIANETLVQAAFANEVPGIAGWIVSFPQFAGALMLRAPLATIIPDAIPFDFPLGWGEGVWQETGEWPLWREVAGQVARMSRSVIVFSQHVGRRHAVKLLGCEAERIRVIPHAPPDLAPVLPFVTDRKATSESRVRAAELVRDHARRKGWAYIADFPIEDVPYAVVSTHDRATKNLFRAAEAIRRLVREEFLNIKMFTTAPLLDWAGWTLLPRLIREERLEFDVLSVPGLPREVHAALLHAAALVIHPSMFEGGLCPFPFYEAVSVGTPCIMASGPHIDELLRTDPDMAPFVFDPHDVDGLITMTQHVLSNREEILTKQRQIFERSKRRSWADVTLAYAEAATGSDPFPKGARDNTS